MRQGLASTEGQNVAKVLAVLLGLGYLGAGVVGFAATGFSSGFVADTNASLLGLDLNIFHNVVHVAIGAGLLIASRMRDVTITQGVLIGVGLFYVLAALLGFINYLQIISIDASVALDNFFHLVTGATALIFGLLGARQSASAPGPRGPVGPERSRPIEERRALWDSEDTYREEAY